MTDLAEQISGDFNAFAGGVTPNVGNAQAPLQAKAWLANQNNSTPSFSLNANCWANGYAPTNFGSRAVFNPWAGNCDGPTLIHAQFGICAAHFGHPTSGTCIFLAPDGSLVTATVSGGMQIGTTDIWLVYFATPVAGITPALLPPTNLTDYLALPVVSVTVKADFTNPALEVVTQDLVGLDGNATVGAPTNATRLALYEPIITGASGSPLYLVVAGQEVLLGTWLSPNFVPLLYENLVALESAASTLAGSAITFSTLDLSSYSMLPSAVTSFAPSQPSLPPGGGNVTLAWDTFNAASVNISDVGNNLPASGTAVVAVTATKTFTLSTN